MFLKALPFILMYILLIVILSIINPWLEFSRILFELFIIPMLSINFINKMTVSSFFEFRIIKYVFNNLEDYIIVLLKSILLALIFIIMWIVLVGLPAGAFTRDIFLADFYRRKVK